jgi:DNA-binding XRE family transcriptional regulator
MMNIEIIRAFVAFYFSRLFGVNLWMKDTFYIVKRDKKSIFGDSSLKPMNRIKEVLEEKGIKQKWLAEKLGKSYNMVNGYVQNRQQPKLEILFDIAKILEVQPRELLRETK